MRQAAVRAVIYILLHSLNCIATAATPATASKNGPFFLPSGDATKIVTVTAGGEAEAGVTVVTEAVAIKETGLAATVAKFGEVYAFSPDFIALHRDEPTQIE